MFGHPVALNFNRKGSTANTVVGGVVSILLKAFLLVFLIQRTMVMLNREDNDYQVSDSPLDSDEFGEIELNDEDEGF